MHHMQTDAVRKLDRRTARHPNGRLPQTPIEKRPYRRRRRVGPYSRDHKFTVLDGRTQEAAFMRDYKKKLTEHLGGDPDFIEKALIDRAAVLALRIALMDQRLAEGDSFAPHDLDFHNAWSNSLTRLLLILRRHSRQKQRQRLGLRDNAQIAKDDGFSLRDDDFALRGEDVLDAFASEEDDLAPPPTRKEVKSKPRAVVFNEKGERDVAAELLGDHGKSKRKSKRGAK